MFLFSPVLFPVSCVVFLLKSLSLQTSIHKPLNLACLIAYGLNFIFIQKISQKMQLKHMRHLMKNGFGTLFQKSNHGEYFRDSDGHKCETNTITNSYLLSVID